MPFDGSGNFNRVRNWVNDALGGIKIKSDFHDQEDDNFASGLSNVITKDGQTQPTANLPMNGKKLLNLAAPTNATDAATKGYVDGIRSFSTAITLTGAVPEARVGFSVSDIGFGARVAGTPAGSVNRFVWNDKPDLSGADVAVLDETGNLSLLGANLVRNAIQGTGGWAAMSVGYAGWEAFDKTTGRWTYFATAASVAAGAAAVPVAALAIDNTGKMAVNGAAFPPNNRNGMFVNSDLALVGSGALLSNSYWDTVSAAYKAYAAGWVGAQWFNPTTGSYNFQRSASTLAAGALSPLTSFLLFDPTSGVTFVDFSLAYGNGTNNIWHQNRSPFVVTYKMAGSGAFSWYKSSTGLSGGASPTVLMTLDDNGGLVASGNVSAFSDPRLKDDVAPITDALAIIDALDGVRFTWNNRSSVVGEPGKHDIGVLADQVEAVLPEIVGLSVPDESGERWQTVAYDKLVPVLIEAIKELQTRIGQLEART